MVISPYFGAVYFEFVFSTEHQKTVTLTTHPVQYGAVITDHAIIEPEEVTVSLGTTESFTPATVQALGEGYVPEQDHSVNAFQLLNALMERREPLRLVTRLHTYDNMLITSMSVPDDYKTMSALRATLIFTKVNVAVVGVVSVQQSTSGSQSGTRRRSSTRAATRTQGTTDRPESVSTVTQVTRFIDSFTGGAASRVVTAITGWPKK